MSLGLVIWMAVIVAAVMVGIVVWAQSRGQLRTVTAMREAEGGWVYFLSAIDGGDEEPPALIKVGMTHRDPAVERLPEIETMSPKPLEVIYSFFTKAPGPMETAIHRELAPFRHHGEWFERWPTLAWIDNHKGAA